jgi:hypothetical protein
VSAPSFALLAGLLYVAAGVLGLLFGLVPASLIHHAAHFAIGLWGLAAWTGAASAVTYARSLAAIAAAFALLGLTGLDTALGMLPLDTRDLWGHIVIGAFGAYFGFRTAALPEAHAERRRNMPSDRRRAARPISLERRRGTADRRFGSAFGL